MEFPDSSSPGSRKGSESTGIHSSLTRPFEAQQVVSSVHDSPRRRVASLLSTHPHGTRPDLGWAAEYPRRVAPYCPV